jgi:D-alanyl-D-alanine endopeptidase (penicillin-binding protein 7)|tara:strand:+ start:2787 stop:3665 length:879 start_codon:yes stop_codon:yes gene_type:complete
VSKTLNSFLIIFLLLCTTSQLLSKEKINDPKVRSLRAMIVNQQSGEIIYKKNSEQKASIASLTKLMTAMVVLDSGLDLSEELRISKKDIDKLKWTKSRLHIGATLSRLELLKVALISSDNRAAYALSRTYPSGRKAFIEAMNVKAIQLGMENSQFRDPTGLDKRNISTAEDLVKMVQAAYEYKLIRQITTTPSEKVTIGRRNTPLGFMNTNRLVRRGVWDIGLSKTGFIREAGRCLVMQTMINNKPIIMVFLKSHGKYTRLGDANRVKKWIEKNNYKKNQITHLDYKLTPPS